jgi:hypothetical protein
LQDLLIEDGRILAIDNPGFEVSDDAEMLSGRATRTKEKSF